MIYNSVKLKREKHITGTFDCPCCYFKDKDGCTDCNDSYWVIDDEVELVKEVDNKDEYCERCYYQNDKMICPDEGCDDWYEGGGKD